jgi:hypothetical protein
MAHNYRDQPVDLWIMSNKSEIPHKNVVNIKLPQKSERNTSRISEKLIIIRNILAQTIFTDEGPPKKWPIITDN